MLKVEGCVRELHDLFCIILTDPTGIVINNVVYDCTKFIFKHPGGQQIIKSFAGAECTWQFYKFHGSSILKNLGGPLRVGQTENLMNKFTEPPRYIGLMKMERDECY